MNGATTEYTVNGISDVEVEETDSLLTKVGPIFRTG